MVTASGREVFGSPPGFGDFAFGRDAGIEAQGPRIA